MPPTDEELKLLRVWTVSIHLPGEYHWLLPTRFTHDEAHELVKSYFEYTKQNIEWRGGRDGTGQYWHEPQTGYSAANVLTDPEMLSAMITEENNTLMLERLTNGNLKND